MAVVNELQIFHVMIFQNILQVIHFQTCLLNFTKFNFSQTIFIPIVPGAKKDVNLNVRFRSQNVSTTLIALVVL